jgi:O-antigen ligase
MLVIVSPRERFGFIVAATAAILMVGVLCISLVAMHVAFSLAVLACILLRPPVQHLPGFYWGVAFAAWQLIGAAWLTYGEGHDALWHSRHGAAFTWLAGYLFVIGFASQAVRTWALRIACLAVVASVSLAFCQFFIGHGGEKPWRVSSAGPKWVYTTGFMPINLSQGFILTQIGLLFWLGKEHVGNTKIMRFCAWFISSMGVIIANSRTGFWSFLIATLACLCIGRWNWRRALLVVGSTILLIGGLAWWMKTFVPSKWDTMIVGQDARWTIYHVASVITQEKPWFGTGPNGGYSREHDIVLKRLYPDGSQNGLLASPDAHNIILGLTSEHGIPALFLFFLMVGAILRHLYRRRAENPDGWRIGLAACAALAVSGQFENYVGHSATSYAFFTVIGIALALDRSYLIQHGIIRDTSASGADLAAVPQVAQDKGSPS